MDLIAMCVTDITTRVYGPPLAVHLPDSISMHACDRHKYACAWTTTSNAPDSFNYHACDRRKHGPPLAVHLTVLITTRVTDVSMDRH